MTQPYVKMVNLFSHAYDNFVATARTCYSSKGIVNVEQVSGAPDAEPSLLEQRRQKKYALAQSLFKAGHHTTLQHAHAQFALDKISRQFIWSFLHSHPFYNSEQVSQRYVTVKEENFHIPETLKGESLELYLACVREQMASYQELCELMKPLVEKEYYARFRGRYGTKRAATDIVKRAQEVARSVLPVATHAYLYHTVSVITLLRYYRVCQQYDVPAEQKTVITAMVQELLRAEPEFETVLQEPLEIESYPEFRFYQNQNCDFIDTKNAELITGEFDELLKGSTSILFDYNRHNEVNVADAVRETLGIHRSVLSDADALDLVLNPAKNTLYGDVMNINTLSKMTRSLFHAHYVFKKVLSHAGDSQDQRHRMTPASRPILMRHFTGKPDFVTPEIVKQDENVLRKFNEAMEKAWDRINALLSRGESPEVVSYLLPNAVKIRFTESSDLLNLHHKMAMRLCYNAQEEIWRASLDEAQAVYAVNPDIGKWLLPPCGLRNKSGEKPFCPEGDRYCGVPVWRLDKKDYVRLI